MRLECRGGCRIRGTPDRNRPTRRFRTDLFVQGGEDLNFMG
jgi:hypothetical protein